MLYPPHQGDFGEPKLINVTIDEHGTLHEELLRVSPATGHRTSIFQTFERFAHNLTASPRVRTEPAKD